MFKGPLPLVLATALIGAIIVAGVAYSSSDNLRNATTTNCAALPINNQDAPQPGIAYFLFFNKTDGSVNSLETEASCELGPGTYYKTLSIQNVIGVMNVTSSPYLRDITVNGYLNAFYVNLKTLQLTMIPGIIFQDYYHVYYNGELITNGTKVRIP